MGTCVRDCECAGAGAGAGACASGRHFVSQSWHCRPITLHFKKEKEKEEDNSVLGGRWQS